MYHLFYHLPYLFMYLLSFISLYIYIRMFVSLHLYISGPKKKNKPANEIQWRGIRPPIKYDISTQVNVYRRT